MPELRLLDLSIDLDAQQVRREGALLPVHGLTFQLLSCLLRHGSDVVSFDQLADEVWAPAVVGEDAITQRVKLLRQALGDDGRRPRYVRSVRGQGYQLCSTPRVLEASAVEVAGVDRSRRWRYAAAGAGVAVLGAALAMLLWPRDPAPSASSALVQRAEYYAGIGQASNTARAVELYRQALQASPDDVRAMLGLSRALSAQVCLYNAAPSIAKQAQALADRAVRVAPAQGAPWAARGYAQDCLGDMRAAIADYSAALERDPGDERTRASLAYLLQERGQLARALEDNMRLKAPERVRFRDVQVARELELLGFTVAAQQRHARNFQLYPDNVFANIAWPRSLYLAGESSRAGLVLEQALDRGTPHPDLLRLQGELALQRGDAASARMAFEAALRLRPQRSLARTLLGLHDGSVRDPAWRDARLQQVNAQPDDGWSDVFIERALLLQARGEPAAAIAALHQAVDAGFRDQAWLRVTPLLSGVRGQVGWDRLIARIDEDLRQQRRQVLAAAWRPQELRVVSAAPEAGSQ